MKKHAIITLLSLCLITSFVPVFASGIHEEPDIRKSNWGDSMQEVIAAEGREPDDAVSFDCEYIIEGNPYFDNLLFYLGDANSLFCASYSINYEYATDYPGSTEEAINARIEYYKQKNIDTLHSIKNQLVAKYGNGLKPDYNTLLGLIDSPEFLPIEEYWDDVDTYWVTERTIISLYVPDSLGFAYLNYLSRTPKADAGRSNAVYLDALI